MQTIIQIKRTTPIANHQLHAEKEGGLLVAWSHSRQRQGIFLSRTYPEPVIR